MNRNIRNNMTKAVRIFTLLAVSLGLAACGGGAGDQVAGIGGTGITYGKITGFGSIFVNGVEYDTSSSTFNVDDNPSASQSDLEIGMVARLRVETLDGKLTSKATEVDYNEEVQGPVAATPQVVLGSGGTKKTFDVLGKTITIDEIDTIFKGNKTFGTLAAGDLVEISGFRESATLFRATYVEVQGTVSPGTSEVELRGDVDQYLGGNDFKISGIVINILPGTVIDVPGGLSDGKSVEVKGVIQVDDSINAGEIKLEDDDFSGQVDEISLQGIIANFNSIADFEIDGLAVNASSALNLPTLPTDPNGLEVEVEGDLVGGVLVANKFELREGESKVEALVQSGSVDTGTGSFQVYYPDIVGGGAITVRTDSRTLFKDESASALPDFSLGNLGGDDFVHVEGQEIAGELVANIVKRVDDPGAGSREFELEGAVDAFSSQNWIQILGIQFPTDDGTETKYEDANENSLAPNEFFDQLGARPNGGVGTLLDIKDDKETYGVADRVEFEN